MVIIVFRRFDAVKAGLFRPNRAAQHILRGLLPPGRIHASGIQRGPLGSVRIDAVLVKTRDDTGAGDALGAAVEISRGHLGGASGPGDRCDQTARIGIIIRHQLARIRSADQPSGSVI